MATLGEISVIVNKHVISDQPPGDAPRLMLIFRNHLSESAHAQIKESLKIALESGKPMVIDGGAEVFQLIDGKWLHLDGSIELEDVPTEPAKVKFREFI